MKTRKAMSTKHQEKEMKMANGFSRFSFFFWKRKTLSALLGNDKLCRCCDSFHCQGNTCLFYLKSDNFCSKKFFSSSIRWENWTFNWKDLMNRPKKNKKKWGICSEKSTAEWHVFNHRLIKKKKDHIHLEWNIEICQGIQSFVFRLIRQYKEDQYDFRWCRIKRKRRRQRRKLRVDQSLVHE